MQTLSQTLSPIPAPALKLSQHQSTILDFIKTSPKSSLIVDACAGAAKTTTLVQVCHAISSANLGSTLALAFNKSIATELASRLEGTGTHTGTINSIGHRALGSFTRLKLRVQDTKVWGYWKECCPYFHSLDKEIQSEIIQGYSWIKKLGAAYTSPAGLPACKPVITECPSALLQAHLNSQGIVDLDIVELLAPLPEIWRKDITESLRSGIIQFADQIYLPAIFPQIALPTYQHVIVDEAQDLSGLDHQLLRRLVSKFPAGRLIAFGDRGQAIYGFRGADYDSFASLEKLFQAQTLPLPVSFRCPQAVVAEAARIDPRIQPWDQAPLGSVSRIQFHSFNQLPHSCTVLCRTNAPLLRLAIQAIKNLVGVNFLGRDLEKMLHSYLSRFSKDTTSVSGLWTALQIAGNQIEGKGPKARHEDLTQCLKAIAEWQDATDLQHIASGITELFSSPGSLTLATIHKSKGLEWPDVFLLRPDLLPSPFATTPEEIIQENNMHYVAVTRAQNSFTYLDGDSV